MALWLVAVSPDRRASMKLSCFHMNDVHLIPSPPPALHMFLLNNLVMLKQIPNSFANKQMKCKLCEMLKRKRCYGNKFESLHGYFVRSYALSLRTMPI